MDHIIVKNGEVIGKGKIPVLDYHVFYYNISELLRFDHNHVLNYYGYRINPETIQCISCIANDKTAEIYVSSYIARIDQVEKLDSFTADFPGMNVFEREITENFGIKFSGSFCDKPLRYSFNRIDKHKVISNYPFYAIHSDELHEVGVGPIHAGIIEPGHFRFICNGEKVLHLEIQLGYQHRGVEDQFIRNRSLLQRTVLAESITGDSTVANTTIFCSIMESLAGKKVPEQVDVSRSIALELERIAMHTGDLSALCTDIAYQIGSAVLQGLRTVIINTFLIWCGNRFGRGLVRAGYEPFILDEDLKNQMLKNLSVFETRFIEVTDYLLDTPNVLARFEGTGVLSKGQAELIQVVGMIARTSGMTRDIRKSHPSWIYESLGHQPVCLDAGDVLARAVIRQQEVCQSLGYIKRLLQEYHGQPCAQDKNIVLMPDCFVVAATEGWRGEHCHCAITDASGDIQHYKVKDPSLHNWLGLAIGMRNNDISDFPVCNKSFDLSYCGYDL